MNEESSGAPLITIRPRRGLFDMELGEVWRARELLGYLVWRDIKVRYKQSVIGAGWAIIQPVLTMVVFTVVFGRLAKVPSDGLPYPIFAYTALLPWGYFSSAMTRGGLSVVASTHLVRKVYFPRLIIPIAAITTPLLDFLLAFLVLLGMMAWYRIVPSLALLTLPLFMALAMMTAMAVALWLAPINVRYRDIGHVLPFMAMLWMYASPVAYPVSLIPERFRAIYGLNPMAGVIEGFRWAMLGKAPPDPAVLLTSTTVVLVLFLGGLVFYSRQQDDFVDVI
jgi:lipopolysaccharide transport system permease protein